MTISVLATSDIHCHPLKEIVGDQTADILLIVGDLTYRGTAKELLNFEHGLTTIRDQFEEIYFTPGNHDMGFEDWPHLGYEIAARTKTHYLVDQISTYKGIRIFMSPYSSEFGSWAFQVPRGTKKWYNLPPAEIHCFHGPAFGFRDQLINRDGTPGERVGDWDLASMLTTMNPRPKYVLSGHIHNQSGMEMHNGITFIGCSVVGEDYEISNSGQYFTVGD